MKRDLGEPVVCVIGLGYVGVPLAEAFAKKVRVIGFDTNAERVTQLIRQGASVSTQSLEPLSCTPKLSCVDSRLPASLTYTNDPNEISQASFFIICVPTPVTKSKEPELSYVISSAEIAGRNMKRGSVVILESTVYPGVTEEVVKPILEKESGLKCGEDFKIAYSPERINPGDTEHTIDRITKVVAGMDEETTEIVAALYRKVAPDIFKAKDIRTAEAAKVIENVQRDLNIALVNELALIFEKMGLSTKDVLEAAATKWNFHRYYPGLVGGHCIPVDPYYLVYKAKELGYHPQVILAGRATNDYMPKHIAEITIKALNEVGKVIKFSRVLIMGLTFKEDVPDIRESPVKKIVKELEEFGPEVIGFDPLLNADELEGQFNIKVLRSLEEAKQQKVDCIVLAVAHSSFRRLSLTDLKAMQSNAPILIDVRGVFDAEEAKKVGFSYKTI